MDVSGIEPPSVACKTTVLPLNDTSITLTAGVEPAYPFGHGFPFWAHPASILGSMSRVQFWAFSRPLRHHFSHVSKRGWWDLNPHFPVLRTGDLPDSSTTSCNSFSAHGAADFIMRAHVLMIFFLDTRMFTFTRNPELFILAPPCNRLLLDRKRFYLVEHEIFTQFMCSVIGAFELVIGENHVNRPMTRIAEHCDIIWVKV